ncbi:polyamine transporter tpo5 [Sporothrix bragantina]|uniref:Polyamine transporter tpo5 n=1 Tax=Sporothrix bragantina TaxID=671064 RepID=A0ABP0B054_9PEZI
MGNPAAQIFLNTGGRSGGIAIVWAVVILCYLLNHIALSSTINGIFFGMTAPAIDLSYIAVIAARIYYRKTQPIIPGPFVLGRLQLPINIIAIVWTVIISVILIFPTTYPITALNMNYAIIVGAFIFVFALFWWYIGAKRFVSTLAIPFI